MKLIETKTLVSAQASIEFTSIPQDFTDLVVLLSVRSSRTEAVDGLEFRPNGSTTNFSWRRLFGDGATGNSSSGTNTEMSLINSANNTSNTFTNVAFYIPNYTSAANKSFSSDGVTENNATTAYQALYAGLWSQTTAITSLYFGSATANNLIAGSTISLYGILKGSDGIVTTTP
jgi:hypothetical protein